jgi:hypothetical protein
MVPCGFRWKSALRCFPPAGEVVSVPYAFYAEKAMVAGSADSLGGEPSSAYSVAGHDHDDRYYTESELGDAGTINNVSNPVDWTKLKTVPGGFADGTDDVGGSGDGHSLDAADGSPVDVVYVDNAGEVGIGTTSPERSVHIYEGSAGSVTSTSGAELVIEDDDNTGSSSAKRISFDNEDGSLAYIATYDDGSATTPSSMVIANNRPSGDLRFRTGGTDRLRISDYGATYVTAPGGSPLQCSTSGHGYIEIETSGSVGTGLRMDNDHRTWYLLHSPAGNDRICLYDSDATSERLTITGGTGYQVGGYFKATNTSTVGTQRALWCTIGTDDYTHVCYRHSNGQPYDVLTSSVTNQFYVKKGATGFDVIVTCEGAETVDATFDYRVIAARKNHEKMRFVEAESPEEAQAQTRMVEHQAPEE